VSYRTNLPKILTDVKAADSSALINTSGSFKGQEYYPSKYASVILLPLLLVSQRARESHFGRYSIASTDCVIDSRTRQASPSMVPCRIAAVLETEHFWAKRKLPKEQTKARYRTLS
jgi:hypothetical protein